MARAVRIEYNGTFYHVMARGNRRERIFRDEADRLYFARLFGEACERTGWRMHAWVLMSNHYHLMVETPGGNLVAGMRWLQSIYTRRHKVPPSGYGTGFSGIVTRPFLSEGGSGYYYCSLMDYMHLNPVRAGLVRAKRGESVRDYVWSSVARVMPCSQLRRPIWLVAKEGLATTQFADMAAGRRRFVSIWMAVRAMKEFGRG